jgi:hypothetical protein
VRTKQTSDGTEPKNKCVRLSVRRTLAWLMMWTRCSSSFSWRSFVISSCSLARSTSSSCRACSWRCVGVCVAG